jgi:hypothetical protein
MPREYFSPDMLQVLAMAVTQLPIQVRIEFYRTRACDEAHAVLGRVSRWADDLDHAISLARRLLATLDMPQWPDAMTISDVIGNELCRCAIGPRGERDLSLFADPFIERTDNRNE